MAGDLLYAKTQRIVLLIDLNPLLVKPNPEQYIAVVTSAAEKLLSFSPLSTSLFSFQFFFSSLSSILSSSKLSALSISSSSLSFDFPSPTLVSLRRALDAVKRCELLSSSTAAASPRGVHVAANLRQIVYDYAWEPVVRDPDIGMITGFTDGGMDVVKSNLVVMFSPISRDLKWVSEFLDVQASDKCLSDLGLFKSKLGEIFECVNDLFDDRDILLSWIDVKSDDSFDERSELGLQSGFFDSGIRELGWGHCSTDSIVFGSSIVPFGLIYPTIGICPKLSTFKKFTVQTSLEIADNNGKPIECKCGDLGVSSSEFFTGKRCDEFIDLASRHEEPNKDFPVDQFCDRITKVSIKALRMCDDLIELERFVCDTFVVHEVSQESDQDQEQESGFWADRIFQILVKETGEKVAKRSLPIWQILLSYLYREGYSALVSLSNSNGGLRTGILKPFTFSSALICVFDSEVSPETVDLEDSSKKVRYSEYKRKPRKNFLNSLHDISWEEFCKSVKDYGQIDLEDVYFSKFGKSKKYKFLKCWMKQISKPRGCSISVAGNCNAVEHVEADPIEEMNNSREETEKANSPILVVEEDIALSGNRISGKQENDASVHVSDSSEDFFASLPSKIKQGIESKEIDLSALAERLVNSCVVHSSQRAENDYSCESGTLSLVTEELTKMLLKEPKDLVAKFKKIDSSSTASEQKSEDDASSSIVREYELQILFRMEILRAEKGFGSEKSVTQKFSKEICMLLEGIQCKLDGGFFGEWSLDKYVDKTIKARYNHNLGEVVKLIYKDMDLIDEDLEDSLMDNEESSQSGRENIHTNLKSHHHSQRSKYGSGSSKKTYLQKDTKECREAKKEAEAQERRERARRFSSFTSWMPDLCRVWAPKQAKNSKGKADKQHIMAKRKKQERSVEYDRVCETPTTPESKRNRTGNKEEFECGTKPRSSVPKALFQDDS